MGRTTYKTAPKGGLYTRLSVDDGITDRESNSITSQKQMLMQYAQYHGIEVVETYVDDGWSGTNFERPDFKRMIEDIESGKSTRSLQKTSHVLGVTTCRQDIIPRYISLARKYAISQSAMGLIPLWGIMRWLRSRTCLTISTHGIFQRKSAAP